MRTIQSGSIYLAVLLAQSEARAETCTPPTPTCHLEQGKQLLSTDPKRAAAELLASFKLDERTDTLVLYARALERDHQYALAAETWQRIIGYRDSELTAAREAGRAAAIARARKLADQASDALARLAPKTARVRIRFAAGPKPTVSRGGVDVDAAHELVVNAGHDELVFTRQDGSAEHLTVDLAAGDNVRIDAPEPASKPPPPPEREPTRPARPQITTRSKPAAAPVVTNLAMTDVADHPRSHTMSRVGLGLLAGAAVAGGIAGGLGYLSQRDFDRARDAGCSASAECTPGAAVDLAERSNDRARLAQVSAIGAGALLVTGVTLWVVGHARSRHAATEVTVGVAPSSATLAWRF